MRSLACIALVLVVAPVGCGSSPDEPDAVSQSPRLRDAEPPVRGVDRLPSDPGPDVIDEDALRPQEPFVIGRYQPKVDLSIEVMESLPEQYAARWSIVVNTGGWRMETDRIEHDGKVLRAFITLEKPGADEITTQALETLSDRHAAGTDVVERAELYIRAIVRGEDDGQAKHVLVAVAP